MQNKNQWPTMYWQNVTWKTNLLRCFCLKKTKIRNSHPVLFLGKAVLEICSKFTGEHPCRSVISIKLLCNIIEIALQHGCSPGTLLHISRTPFPKNISERLLLENLISFASQMLNLQNETFLNGLYKLNARKFNAIKSSNIVYIFLFVSVKDKN